MAKKQVHYSIKNIMEKNANYNIIYGEKSNGKSYQVKHKCAIEHYLETHNRFILMRRWQLDISQLWIEKYFNDVDIEKLTDGRYTIIDCYRKELYLANLTEEGKVKRGEKIGYVIALSAEQHYSSGSFLDVDTIIYEEFMERGCYIAHEPDKLMAFYNTVDRKRGTTKLWLVGNTITRVNPYLHDWGLQMLIRRQKQGDIDVIKIPNEENDVTIAIEYCKASGGKTMAIGNASSMIDSGAWQTNPQPKLHKSIKEYESTYRIGFQYQGFKFLADLLMDKETKDYLWFVYPYYREFKDGILIFSDTVKQSDYWQRDIYDITINNKKLRNLLNTFREANIFYSNDLCGTDFKEAIDFSIRR